MAEKKTYTDLADGDIVEYNQDGKCWVKAKVFHHYRGQLMIELLEGRLKGKQWYLFPDLKHIRI